MTTGSLRSALGFVGIPIMRSGVEDLEQLKVLGRQMPSICVPLVHFLLCIEAAYNVSTYSCSELA